MRWRPVLFGLAMGVLGMPSLAWSILIETRPGVQVRGYLDSVSDDGKRLKIRILQGDGTETFNEYELSKITVLHQIDKGRLEKLDKADPKTYLDYAEKLAAEAEK